MTAERPTSPPDIENLIETGQLFRIGELPPLEEGPRPLMFAQTIRQSRYAKGERRVEDAFQIEVVKTPRIEKPDDVLIYPMAAGVNFNGVRAALGDPLDAVAYHKRTKDAGDSEGFHIGGSDASGIVCAIGSAVENVKVGDDVVTHCAMAPGVVWGLESNYGSFAQVSRLKAHQLLPKAKYLTWEEAAVYMLDFATAYKMLKGWPPHTVKKGDVVLVWGASGGVGSSAIQLVNHFGARAIAVVSSKENGEWAKSIGAEGYVNRSDFGYWTTPIPNPNDTKAYNMWLTGEGNKNDDAPKKRMEDLDGPRAFQRAIEEIVGKKVKPRIVFEHTGESTMPTSLYVCEDGGMVVFCGATTGNYGNINLLRLFTSEGRLQGSHVFKPEHAKAVNNLVRRGKIKPHLSADAIFLFEDTGLAHQKMFDNYHPPGKMAILVNSPQPGLGRRV